MREKNITMKIDTSNNYPALRVSSTSYIEEIESKHPGYLHYLYRYSINAYGAKFGFQLLSTSMNQKSDAHSEQRPTTNMSRQELNNWFIVNKGKEY